MHTDRQSCVEQQDILDQKLMVQAAAKKYRCDCVLQKTYARLFQSTSPDVSAALVVQTTLLGVLFFNAGSRRLVKYACPK